MRAISTDIICQTIVQHCRTSDLELAATCRIKLRLSLSLSLLSNPDLKLICFLLLSANYFTYLFCQCLCSRLTSLWRNIISHYYYYYYYDNVIYYFIFIKLLLLYYYHFTYVLV